MTVEQGTGVCNGQFPVGMRVLAVDDNPTCLKVLETLLRRCQYHVTTTNQAIQALKMLRENKNNFDLVISDVDMPDMDGFKLLELVGLEMDLPVIMLSAYGDPKLVMKGITHGACDYLLKPVRIEELKNIWQHVIRRKKFDKKDQKKIDNQDKFHSGDTDAAPDQKLNKKRKDQNDDDDEDHDENSHENEDTVTQKKPRVVWSVELHRKFVAAVNHLGIDKAVPKKILDLMNVEKLTRENVASHLQKYRLYLKRISTVANQQANMVAALGGANSPYLPLASMNGLGFHGLAGSDHFNSAPLRSVSPSGMLSRLNSPAAIGMRGIPSPGVTQLSHAQSASQLNNCHRNIQPIRDPGNNRNILQGMPMPLEFDQTQTGRGVTYSGDLPINIDCTSSYPSSGFPDPRTLVSSSNGQLLGYSNKPFMVDGHLEGSQDGQNFGDQSSRTVMPDLVNPSNLPDHSRCSDNWSNAVQSTGVHLNAFTLGDCLKQVNSRSGSRVGDGMATMSTQLQDTKPDIQCIAANMSSDVRQVINNSTQLWDDNKQDAFHYPIYPSVNPSVPINGTANPIDHSLSQKNSIFQRSTSFNSAEHSSTFDPLLVKSNPAVVSATGILVRSNDGCIIGQQNLQQSHVSNKFSSFNDLWS